MRLIPLLLLPCLLLALLGCGVPGLQGACLPDNRLVLWGYVRDSATGEPIADALLVPPLSERREHADREVRTNTEGMYVVSPIRNPERVWRAVHAHGWYETRLHTSFHKGADTLRYDLMLSKKHPPEWDGTIEPGRLPAVYGYVTDYWSGVPLPGAGVVHIRHQGLKSSTDVLGRYVISNVPPGWHQVEAAYIGYRINLGDSVLVNSTSATRLDFEMQADPDAEIDVR